MKGLNRFWLISALASVALVAAEKTVFAGDEHSMKMPMAPTSPDFERVKKLEGTWTGMKKMGDKDMEVVVTYELTAGGSAVVERLFKGTPHEMTTIYYPEGKKVGLTHYCMLGNHPSMSESHSDKKSISFELDGTKGIGAAGDPHMHAVKITWVDKNHIKSDWTSYEGGKSKECVGFELKRKI